ncbi:MAG: hypothetical protein ABII71_00835 [Candidatus Micrarchaeota archaeon]
MRGLIRTRRFARRAAAAVAITAALTGFCGCGLFASEPMRLDIASMDTVRAKQLGFKRGKTSVEQAKAMMEKRKMTGIVLESYAAPGKNLFDILAADYQEQIHVFKNMSYEGSITLRTKGVPPYGFGIRLAETKGRLALLVLYRDPLDNAIHVDFGMKAQPPRIDVYLRTSKGWAREGGYSLGKMAESHGGLTDPLFVGHSLDDGITFIARNLKGTAWSNGYFISFNGEGLQITKGDSLSTLTHGCSCVRRHFGLTEIGEEARTE